MMLCEKKPSENKSDGFFTYFVIRFTIFYGPNRKEQELELR